MTTVDEPVEPTAEETEVAVETVEATTAAEESSDQGSSSGGPVVTPDGLRTQP